jgi:magnesium-transporting ATPase (P-type)
VIISRRAKGWLLAACVIVAGVAVITPAWIIQPFRPQTDRGVQFALTLRRFSPLLTMVLLAVMAVLASRLWRGARWWSRALMVIALLVTTGCAWLARQNHFEWMFNPLPRPAYVNAPEATFVDDADLVLAVERSGEAAAYPIRQLGYHHVVHDTVGRVPIVVTY